MIKRSLSRNTRAKGFKVKHVVQILLLLGICIWLVYQVKHSHDKKKELNDQEERLSGKMENDPGLLKLGRKDLDPRVEKVDTGEKHHDDEEGDGGDDEERKYEEIENEGRGGGDDEIDENEQEKADNEAEGDADFIDDDKEKDDGEGKDEVEDESSLEEHEDNNTHEAREEHYKGDDASSAVTHDTRSINSETEEEGSSDSEKTEEINGVHDSSRIMEEGANKSIENGNSTSDDGSPRDLILADTLLKEDHLDSNDRDHVRTESSNDSKENPVSSQSQQIEAGLSGNITTNGTTGNDRVSENTHSDPNLTRVSLKDENGNGTIVVFSNSSNGTDSDCNLTKLLKDKNGNGTIVVFSNSSNETGSTQSKEIGSGTSEIEENNGNSNEKGTELLRNGSENAAQSGPIDSSDSHVAHETDKTDKLPEIRTNINHSDETAAE